MSFNSVRLGDVCEITMGQAPPGDTYNTVGEGLPLIAGAGDFGVLSPEATKFTNVPTKVSRQGDVILCIRATIGDKNWSDIEYCLGRGVAGIAGRPKHLDQKYLWHWLGHVAPVLKSKGRGAIFLQVNKADIASLEIPLPPLAEQRRIAAILEKADALRTKRREAIAKLDQLLEAAFLERFGDPIKNPKRIPKKNLRTIARIQTGGTPPSTLTGAFDGSVPFVTPGDLGGLVVASRRTLSEEGSRMSKIAPSGSTLVCCIGATIGKMGFAQHDSAFNQQINAITWGAEIDAKYGYYAMRFLAEDIAQRGTSTTIPILKKSAFEELEITVPGRDEQRSFGVFALSVEQQKEYLKLNEDQFSRLFLALQERLFSEGGTSCAVN